MMERGSSSLRVIDSWVEVEVEVVVLVEVVEGLVLRGARRVSGGRAASGSVWVLDEDVGTGVRTAWA